METHTPDPTHASFFHGWSGRLLLGLAGCATLIGLFYAIENWRGQRAWTKFKREWESKGERFDLAAFVPRPVPDDQNFATTPLLKPLLDYQSEPDRTTRWRDQAAFEQIQKLDAAGGNKYAPHSLAIHQGRQVDLVAWQEFYRDNTNFPQSSQPQSAAADILVALSKFDPEIEELRAATDRPHNQFPVHYVDDEPYLILLPHLAVSKKLAVILQLRAIAQLENRQADRAFQELKIGFHLADALKAEPLLISHLVRLADQEILLQALKEGLLRHAWSDAQLVAFQNEFAKVNLLAEYDRVMRGERAFAIKSMDRIRRGHFQGLGTDLAEGPPKFLLRLVPSGWLYQSELVLSRFHQEHNLAVFDVPAQRAAPGVIDRANAAISQLKMSPFTFLAKILLPAVSNVAPKTARMQTTFNQAILACALERYRLVHGQFPETLDSLRPRFLATLPHDVISGQPLKYTRTQDGQFMLYSVGWDEQDDGGTQKFTKKSARGESQQGDWVW